MIPQKENLFYLMTVKLFFNQIVSSMSDYNKWQMIIAIMKTMNSYPVVSNDSRFMKSTLLRGNSNSIFPDNSIIENPPN